MIFALLPLLVFTLLANLSPDLALWAAFAAAFALALRGFAEHRALRLLELGALAIFGAAALFAGFVPGLSNSMTRLIVDAGFLFLALLSLVLRSPLTLQYTREEHCPESWSRRRFRLTHYGFTALWAVGFATMAAADALANMHKNLPQSLDGAAGLAVLLVGVAATARYRFDSGRVARRAASFRQGHAASLAFSRVAARSRDPLHR